MVQSPVFSLLDGSADGGNEVAGISGGSQNQLLYRVDVLNQVGSQFVVHLFQGESAFQLKLRGWRQFSAMAISGSHNGIIETLNLGDNLQLRVGQSVPGILP